MKTEFALTGSGFFFFALSTGRYEQAGCLRHAEGLLFGLQQAHRWTSQFRVGFIIFFTEFAVSESVSAALDTGRRGEEAAIPLGSTQQVGAGSSISDWLAGGADVIASQ